MMVRVVVTVPVDAGVRKSVSLQLFPRCTQRLACCPSRLPGAVEQAHAPVVGSRRLQT
jgi:hypothetical protein